MPAYEQGGHYQKDVSAINTDRGRFSLFSSAKRDPFRRLLMISIKRVSLCFGGFIQDCKNHFFIYKSSLILISLILILSLFTGCNKDKDKRQALSLYPPLTVIYTSQLKGNALPLNISQASSHEPAHHFSQAAEIIDRLKRDMDTPLLLVDTGGSLSGYDDFSSMFNGMPMIDLFQWAQYDVVVLGGDRGIDYHNIEKKPFLLFSGEQNSVNIRENEEYQQPSFSYVIKDFEQYRVGIYELSIPKSYRYQPIHLDNFFQELDRHAIEKGAQYNIIVYKGIPFNILAYKLNHFQLALPGELDRSLRTGLTTDIDGITAAPFVDSRFNLGRVELAANGEITCRVVPVMGADPKPKDEVLEVLQPYIQGFKEKYPQNYGRMLSEAAGVGIGFSHSLSPPWESSTGDFIADLMRVRTGADIALINHQAVRQDLDGIISISRIQEVLPFNNQLLVIWLEGSDIYDILANSLKRGETFYRISGIAAGLKPYENSEGESSKSGFSPIILTYEGDPLQHDRKYKVAVIDYMVTSEKEKYSVFQDPNKTGLREYAGINLNNVLMEELTESPLIKPPPERIIIDDKIDLTAVKEAAEKLKEHEKAWLGIQDKSQDSIYQGIQAYVEKDYEKAAKLLESSPYPAQFFLALSYFRMGDFEKSREILKKTAEEMPADQHLRRLIAHIPKEDASHAAPQGPPQWRTFKGDFSRRGRTSYQGGIKGELLWRFKTHHSIQSSPAVAYDGTIYCASGDGNLYAVSPEGVQKWSVQLGRVLLASPTISDEGTLYAGADNGIFYAVSPAGKILWKYETGGWIKSTAALDGNGNIYFGSDDKHLYSLTPGGKINWKLPLGDEVFSSPALDEKGRVYVGCLDGSLYCVSAEGKLVWKFDTKGKIFSTPMIDENGTVYAGSDDGHIYAVAPDGKEQWSFKTGGFIPSSPSLGLDDTLYIGSEDYHLYALSNKGKLLWKFKTGYELFGSAVIDAKGNIFFGSDDTHIYALNSEGGLIWKYQTEKYVESSPAVSQEGVIYIGGDDGYLYAIH